MNTPKAELSAVIVVSPLMSLIVDQVSRVVVFLLLSSEETQGLIDKKYLTNERDVKTGRYRFSLYSYSTVYFI